MNHKMIKRLDELKENELKAVTAKYKGFLDLLNNKTSMTQLERDAFTLYSPQTKESLRGQLISMYLNCFPEREEELLNIMKLANIIEPKSRLYPSRVVWGIHLKDLKENWRNHENIN